MKSKILVVVIMLISHFLLAQSKGDRKTTDIDKEIEKSEYDSKKAKEHTDSLKIEKKKADLKSAKNLQKEIDSLQERLKEIIPEDKYINSRISFVVGLGGSYSLDNVYQMPVVSTSDNKVKMEIGQRERITATLGIVYTLYIYRIVDNEHPEGYLAPKGISFVGFFNPVSIFKNSNIEDNFSLSNFGIGVGYKSVTGFGIYGFFEIYSIKQPKQWFIDEFRNGDKEYKVAGNVQSSFSSDDNNIFRNKLYPSIGIKVCYSFDIIKSFATAKE